ncbi:hypothetical protein D3C87_2048450 [compost metagenome]
MQVQVFILDIRDQVQAVFGDVIAFLNSFDINLQSGNLLQQVLFLLFGLVEDLAQNLGR